MEREYNLPPIFFSADDENWKEQLTAMAADEAFRALAELGPTAAVELAVSTLTAYFGIVIGRQIPFLESDGTAETRLATLRNILEHAGLRITTTILTQQR